MAAMVWACDKIVLGSGSEVWASALRVKTRHEAISARPSAEGRAICLGLDLVPDDLLGAGDQSVEPASLAIAPQRMQAGLQE